MSVPCVLVVDDSPTIQKLVEITLRREGIQVVFAHNGITTLAALTRHQPGLIVLDIMLPAINGFQICQIIKQHPRCRGIPIVMLSGKGGTVAKTRGQMVGAAEYLTKPFSPQELLAAVRRNLKEASSEPPAAAARLLPAPIAAEV
ncbi:MAG: response regulator [Chloroflexi bacterium]|nr:response regulator [Chloroflexota bacterium]